VALHRGVYSLKQFSLIEHSWIHYIVGAYGSLLKIQNETPKYL